MKLIFCRTSHVLKGITQIAQPKILVRSQVFRMEIHIFQQVRVNWFTTEHLHLVKMLES